MRALWRDEKLLLLDEPTSMLTPQGVADLGRMMRRLKDKGVALILITHKLLEAYEFGDRISVLRLGRFAGEIDPQRLQDAERGRAHRHGDPDDVRSYRRRRGAGPGPRTGIGDSPRPQDCIAPTPWIATRPPTLSARALATAPDFAETPLREVSFDLWAGEVLGIAGVDGNGQKHLAEVLAGQRALRQGRIDLARPDITRGRVPERRQRGVRYVTDDRLGEGTVGTFSVATNLLLKEIGAPPYWRHGITDWELDPPQRPRADPA